MGSEILQSNVACFAASFIKSWAVGKCDTGVELTENEQIQMNASNLFEI